jgi:hypothetical protein
MSDFIAVEEFEYDFVSASDSGDLSLVPDSPNDKVKINGKKVYTVGTVPKVENFENNSVNNGVGAGPFIPAKKVKAGGEFVIRENDTAVLSGAGTNKNPPPPSLPFASTVQIDDAKQTKVKAT